MTNHVFSLLVIATLSLQAEDTVLVRDGVPKSEIIIAENPLRSVKLAAQELQNYIEKITGAHLPIITGEGSSAATKIFVGRSAQTDARLFAVSDLKDGGYRIHAGSGFLALLGQDTEFSPVEPWAKLNTDLASGKLQREWDNITGALWGAPNPLIYKNRFTVPGDTGLPDLQRLPGIKHPPLQMWGFDERGSFNAV